MKHIKRFLIFLFVLFVIGAIGNAISPSDSGSAGAGTETVQEADKSEEKEEEEKEKKTTQAEETAEADKEADAKTRTGTDAAREKTANSDAEQDATAEQPAAAAFDLSQVPAYSGEPCAYINNNVPYFAASELTTTAFENYSNLDSFGRCGVAYANVCKEIMPTEPRGTIGEVRPSGWHTVKYNGVVDGNYLYNRCHLIGYQLAGENANTKNLITGTRYMNTQGMLPFEDDTAKYVERTNHHVLYRVTPIFEGNNLVASGVLMEAQSVEDNNFHFCVYCYNVQPGVAINYANGDSALDGTMVAQAEEPASSTPAQITQPVAQQEPAATAPADTSNDVTSPYVLNANTKKFHLPSCSSVSTIKAKNRKDYTGSRQNLINQGYQPCKRCNP